MVFADRPPSSNLFNPGGAETYSAAYCADHSADFHEDDADGDDEATVLMGLIEQTLARSQNRSDQQTTDNQMSASA